MAIVIHIEKVYILTDPPDGGQVARIERKLDELKGLLVVTKDELIQELVEINTATDEIAANQVAGNAKLDEINSDIDDLKNLQSLDDVAAAADEIKAKVSAIRDQSVAQVDVLTAIAAKHTPENPEG